MKNIALIFPGQGAQKVGMGKDLYETSLEAKAVFDEANGILKEDLTSVIFEGPEDKLMSSIYCQPAIFTMSMAAFAAFKAHKDYQNISVRYTAGLSLGEYGALCAAGVLSFADTLKLLRQRALLMDEAVKNNPGKMAAVIGFDQEKLKAICQEAGCEIANINAPDQIVITGKSEAVLKASQMITDAGCKKVIALDVAGGFHSTLMKSAGDQFSTVLKDYTFYNTDIKVVSNVHGQAQVSVEEIKANLPKQIYSSVQWVRSIEFMAQQGIVDFVEIGPGKVLKGLVRKINPQLNVYNIQTTEDISTLSF